MTSDGQDLLFDAVIDALFRRALAGQLPARAVKRLRELGVDLGRTLRPAYPKNQVLEALAITAEELFPGLEPDRAHFELGRRLVRGFQETLRGRALTGVARVLGPERLLAKVGTPIRTPSNFLRVELRPRAARDYELRLNLGAPHPELLQGMATAILEAARAPALRVEIAERGQGVEVLRLRWS